jgi:hypothetical protein
MKSQVKECLEVAAQVKKLLKKKEITILILIKGTWMAFKV